MQNYQDKTKLSSFQYCQYFDYTLRIVLIAKSIRYQYGTSHVVFNVFTVAPPPFSLFYFLLNKNQLSHIIKLKLIECSLNSVIIEERNKKYNVYIINML